MNVKLRVRALFIALFTLQAVAVVAAPFRIVSMAPSITETVFFLGKDKSLVGVTTACSYPRPAQDIEKIGGFGNPSLEKIVSLQPTHIFTWSSQRHPVSRSLERLGYRIRDYRAETVDEIMLMIRDIANELQVEDRAPIERLKGEIADLRQSVPEGHAAVCILFWDDPLLTVGGDSFINEILQLSGAKNVFGDDERSYFPVNTEMLAVRKPTHLLLLMEPHQAQNLKRNPFLSKLIADKSVLMIENVDYEKYLRAGPRIADAVRELRKALNQ